MRQRGGRSICASIHSPPVERVSMAVAQGKEARVRKSNSSLGRGKVDNETARPDTAWSVVHGGPPSSWKLSREQHKASCLPSSGQSAPLPHSHGPSLRLEAPGPPPVGCLQWAPCGATWTSSGACCALPDQGGASPGARGCLVFPQIWSRYGRFGGSEGLWSGRPEGCVIWTTRSTQTPSLLAPHAT